MLIIIATKMMSAPVRKILQMLSLILKTMLQGRYYYLPLKNAKIEA